MKKISILSLLFFLFSFLSNAQEVVNIVSLEGSSRMESYNNKYSKESLANASMDDLNRYLEKAHKLKRKGGILLIVGPATSIVGIGFATAAYSGGTSGAFAAGFLLFLGGIGTALVGLPVLITGSTRVNKVKKALSTHVGAGLNIAPGFVYLDKTQNLYPGLTLRVRF